MEQVVEQLMDLIAPVLNKAVELACTFVTSAAKKLWQFCGAAHCYVRRRGCDPSHRGAVLLEPRQKALIPPRLFRYF